MKILITTVDWAEKGGGGLTRFSKGLAFGLKQNGINVHVLIEENGPNSQKSENSYIIHTVKYAGSPLKRAYQFAIRMFRITNNTFNAVLCISWSPVGIAALLNKILRKIPYWVTCQGNDIIEPRRSLFYRFLMKIVLKNADKILCISDFTAKEAINSGAKKDKLKIIGCGITPSDLKIDPDNFSLRKKHNLKSNPVILTVGRLIPRKGQDMVIKAMPYIIKKYPDCVYVIIGEGNDKERLIKITSETKVPDNVIFTGFLNDSLAYQCMAECDVFIMPSRNIINDGEVEGFGIVFLEANYFKKPVIAGNAGGMSDAVLDGETGFLVDPMNPKNIANNILRLLDDKNLRNIMGAKGRDRVLNYFTWNKVAERIFN